MGIAVGMPREEAEKPVVYARFGMSSCANFSNMVECRTVPCALLKSGEMTMTSGSIMSKLVIVLKIVIVDAATSQLDERLTDLQ